MLYTEITDPVTSPLPIYASFHPAASLHLQIRHVTPSSELSHHSTFKPVTSPRPTDPPEESMPLPQTHSRPESKHRSFQLTLLTAFSVLAILIVLSSTLLFTGLFINDTYRQLEENGLRQLIGCRDEFDRVFMQSREINQYLRQNPDFSSYLYSNTPDMLVINRARLTFGQVQYVNPYIYSIVFFNRSFPYDLSNMKTGKTGLDVAALIGSPLSSPLLETDLTLAHSTLSGKPIAGIAPQSTLSIVFGEITPPLKDTADTVGQIGDEAVIVTLDPEEIGKKLLGAMEGITYITDAKGTILFANAEYKAGDMVSSLAYFHRILQSGSLSGSFQTEHEKKEVLVSFTHGVYAGYTLVNIHPSGGFLTLVRSKLLIIGLISIGVILVYVLAGAFLSRRLSSPVKRIKEIIERNGFNDMTRKQGELAFITDVFEKVSRQKYELEAVNADQTVLLKADALRTLLTMTGHPDAAPSVLARCSFDITFRNTIAVCILIDRYRLFEPDRQYVLDNALEKIIPQVLDPSFACACVRVRSGEMAVLLEARNDPPEEKTALIAALDRLRLLMRESFGITLTVAVGGTASEPSACKAAYEAARELANARMTHGLNTTLIRTVVDDIADMSEIYPVEIEQAIQSAIRMGKPALFEHHVDTLLTHLSSFHYQKASSVLIQVVAACIRTFNECLSPDKGYQAIGFDLFTTAFGDMETLQDVKPWLMDVHARFQEKQAEYQLLKNSRQYDLVAKTKAYIEANYRDINLSMDAIAAQNGYTPYYYSKLFKSLAGIGINESIRTFRLDKAKELLIGSTMKAQEISDFVGFANISSFYLAFKKEIGMSPAAYREYIGNIAQNKQEDAGESES
mgnify:CR=1 FL=1